MCRLASQQPLADYLSSSTSLGKHPPASSAADACKAPHIIPVCPTHACLLHAALTHLLLWTWPLAHQFALPHPSLISCSQVPADSRAQMWCSFDGKCRQPLAAGEMVLIRMSQWPVPTVCSTDASRDWFCGVREGLHWNMRRPQAGAGM